MKRTCLLLDMKRNTEYAHLWWVIVIRPSIEGKSGLATEVLVFAGNARGYVHTSIRETSKLLIMNMQFILAALVYSSSADSNLKPRIERHTIRTR